MNRVVAALVAALIGPLLVGVDSSHAQTNPRAIEPRLLDKAAAEGRVRVIVQLNAPFQAEGRLDDGPRTDQRAAIARTRGAVLARLAGGSRALRAYAAIPYMALEVDQATLQAMQQWPEVVSVVEDRIRQPVLSESAPLIGAPAAWAEGATGSGWTVAVLDTGIDSAHPFVGGKIVSEACYSTPSSTSMSLCPGGVSSSTSTGAASQCSLPGACVHGTHVAGIAAGRDATLSGIARDATLIPIQIFTYFVGTGSLGAYDSDILQGLDRVYTLRGSFHIASVNLSLGGETYASNCDAVYPAFKASFDNLISVGIAPVVASGNNGNSTAISVPSCISSAVSVGSTTKEDEVSSFTNSAGILKLLAPGSSILSSVPGGSFGFLSGTSMAAPHVAGAWAALKSRKPNASHAQILNALETTGRPIRDPLNGLVKPRIQVDAALHALLPTLTSVTTNVPSPRPVGTTITWTAATSNIGTFEYRFWLYNIGAASWTELRGYGTSNTIAWTPLQAGSYVMQVWVRTVGEPADYESWMSSEPFQVTSSPVPVVVSLTANRTFPAAPNVSITWQALAVGGTGPLEYQFWRYKVSTSTWTMARAYSTVSTLQWTPSVADGGAYVLQVWVREVGSGVSYQSWLGTDQFAVYDGTQLYLNSQRGDYIGQGQQKSEFGIGRTVFAFQYGHSVNVQFNGAGADFWFVDMSAAGTAELMPGDYPGATRYPFNTGSSPGLSVSGEGRACNALTGRFVVLDAAFGANNTIDRFAADFEQHCEGLSPALFGSIRIHSLLPVAPAPATLTGVTFSAAPFQVGQPLSLTAAAYGGAGDALEYRFWAYKQESAQWTMLRDYGPALYSWTPSQNGTYVIQVWARSVGSAAQYESWINGGPIRVGPDPVAVTSFDGPATVVVGSPSTWTAVATGGSPALEYQFWRYKVGSGWTLAQPYGPSPEFTWTPSPADIGDYMLQVWVRSVGSTASYDAWAGRDFAVR